MMNIEAKIKYPCGYEVYVKASSWFVTYDPSFERECPIHGKKCKRGGL